MDNYFLLINFNFKKGLLEFSGGEKIESIQENIKLCYAGLSTMSKEELKEIIKLQLLIIFEKTNNFLKD